MRLRKLLHGFLRILPASIQSRVRNAYYLKLVKEYAVDEPDQQIVKHLVADGDHALDLGANIGVYTRLLSTLVGPTGKVMAFEPTPDTFEALSYVCSRLSLQNVLARNVAVGHAKGTVSMSIPDGNIYRANINDASEENSFEVAIDTVDALAREAGIKPAFVKIDVEGHELAACNGALGIIEEFRPSLLVEVAGDPDIAGSSAAELFGMFEQLGYSFYWFDGSVLKQRHAGDESINYFFLRPEHLEHIEHSKVNVA